MRRSFVLLFACAAVAKTIGCSLTTSFDGLTGGADDASPTETSDTPDGGRDVVAVEGSVEGGGEGGGDAACPGTAGPAAVRAGTYCVDRTEVTNAQYQQFLEATGGDAGGQSPVCAWNAAYIPTSGWPYASGQDNYPVASVDWCDAYAFCAWAGKRLCGDVAGGPVSFSAVDRNDPSADAWYRACSVGGVHLFPYGDMFDPKACNGVEYHGGFPPVRVASLPTCAGGGLFDMSGNLGEWEDSCNGAAGSADRCSVRGGSFNSGDRDEAGLGPLLRCADLNDIGRSQTYNDVGFRCCSRP